MGKTESNTVTVEKRYSTTDASSDVVNIERPEGNYTVIYGAHVLKLRQDARLLPETMSGVILEGLYDANDWTAQMPSYAEDLKKLDTYKDLFLKLEQNRIPIFSADINSTSGLLLPLTDSALIFAEVVLAGSITERVLKSDLSRRSLLKGAALGSAAYLSLPAASLFLRGLSQLSTIGKDATSELTKISRLSHPEDTFFVAQLRNAVIAAKEKLIMDELGEKPHLVTVIGAGHVDIENRIQDSLESNLEYLRIVKPFLRVFNHESLYTSYRYDFNGSTWRPTQIYEFPKLKEAVS